MAVVRRLLENFVTDERGIETIEFAIMAALIVVALASAVGLLAAAAGGAFSNVATTLGLL